MNNITAIKFDPYGTVLDNREHKPREQPSDRLYKVIDVNTGKTGLTPIPPNNRSYLRGGTSHPAKSNAANNKGCVIL